MIRVKIDIRGMKEAQKILGHLTSAVRNKVIKAAIGKAARRSAKIIKRGTPKGPSGTLRKSVGTRYKSYRHGLTWVFAIGPRSGFRGTASHQPRRTGRDGGPLQFIPTYYGHLAERGRGPVRAGTRKSGKKVTATGKTMLVFYPSPTATFRIAKSQVAAARGFLFMNRGVKYLQSRSTIRQIELDILDGILRESARLAKHEVTPSQMVEAAGGVFG